MISSEKIVIIHIKVSFNFFKPEKKNLLILNQVLLLQNIILNFQLDSKQKQTSCLGGRRYSNTNNIIEYEKLNPKTKKIPIIIKGTFTIWGRNISQTFTK